MPDPQIAIVYSLSGKRGRVNIAVRFPDGSTFTDRIDICSSKSREHFLRRMLKGREGLSREEIESRLEQIANEVVARMDGGADAEHGENEQDDAASGAAVGDGQRRGSQKDILVAFATKNPDVELFHTPGRHDADPYATITDDGHRETWPVPSKALRWWLTGQYRRKCESTPGSQALQDALNAIASEAMFVGKEHRVHVRLAEHEGAIWLDLGDETYSAVEVTPTGWRIVVGSAVPVRFIRRRGMLPLPAPIAGGSIDDLRSLVNLPDDRDWKLYVGFLLGCLRPRGPYVILVVNGEQGSAKSTLCRFARALIDPNMSPLRRPAKDDRDLMIAATNSWIVAFDNMSGVSPALSDSISSIATRGGLGTRELYTDADEKIFDAMRPVILNGIPELTTRPDLLDRAVVLSLPTISEERRRDEDELNKAFEAIRPRLLGAILDAVVVALKRLRELKLPRKPRMADFALWVAAAEPALGWEPGSFLAAFTGNREDARASAIESSPVGLAILELMHRRSRWDGTARELLAALDTQHSDDLTRKRPDWPKTPRALRADLTRIAPDLRASGIDVTFGRRRPGGRRERLIQIEKVGGEPSRPSQSSRHETEDPRDGDREERAGGHPDGQADTDHPSRNEVVDAQSGTRDGRDDGDGHVPTDSQDPPLHDEKGRRNYGCWKCGGQDFVRIATSPESFCATCSGFDEAVIVERWRASMPARGRAARISRTTSHPDHPSRGQAGAEPSLMSATAPSVEAPSENRPDRGGGLRG